MNQENRTLEFKGFDLTPVRLCGVLAPSTEGVVAGSASDYKLLSNSGLEYFILADDQWREVLSSYCWEEVRIVGLLNACNMTLIPQKLYPKGPTGEDVLDLASWKGAEIVSKMVKKINDIIVIPAAV